MMAPEVAGAEQAPLTEAYTKADLYSFGALLFMMIRCNFKKVLPQSKL